MANHMTIAEAGRQGLVSAATELQLAMRYPGYELMLTTPEATAGGWWRAWGRRRREGGGWERANAPWVSHDPERAARALLGERPAEYGR